MKWTTKELIIRWLIENKEPQSIMSVARGVQSLKIKLLKEVKQ